MLHAVLSMNCLILLATPVFCSACLHRCRLDKMNPPSPILLFVYSLCNGIGSPLLALQWAVESFNAGRDDDEPGAAIEQTYIYEISANANKTAAALLDKSKYPGSIHFLGDIKHFNNHAANLPLLIPHGTRYRVLVLSGTPCKSVSIACIRSKFRKKFAR